MGFADGTEYFANQDVIAFSASLGGWVPARIVSTNADDSVTVRYESGHTKLVPLEFQSTHLKPASQGSPPPEPQPIPDASIYNMPSLLNSPILNPPASGQMPQAPSYMGSAAGGQMPSLFANQAGAQAPALPGLGQIPGLGGQPSLFGNQAGGQVQKSQASGKYSVGQDVMVLSESSKSWVAAKVEVVDQFTGAVNVLYGGNQKTIPLEHQHTHLAPLTSGSGQPSAQPKLSSVALPMSYAATPTPTRVVSSAMSPAYSCVGNQQFQFSPQPAAPVQEQFNCGNYAQAPPEQAGTFAFDLSQLCNDAGMPA